MNEMSPLPPSEDDKAMLDDVVMSREELEHHYAERRRENARIRRRERLAKWTRSGIILGLLGVCGAQAAAIAGMLPLEKPVPVIVYQREDGTVVNTVEWSALPRKVQEDTTVNVVWNYPIFADWRGLSRLRD